jgi:hypothetical protein
MLKSASMLSIAVMALANLAAPAQGAVSLIDLQTKIQAPAKAAQGDWNSAVAAVYKSMNAGGQVSLKNALGLAAVQRVVAKDRMAQLLTMQEQFVDPVSMVLLLRWVVDYDRLLASELLKKRVQDLLMSENACFAVTDKECCVMAASCQWRGGQCAPTTR